MEKYVGLDVSMEETSVCVLDGGGNIVFEGKTSSQPDALSKLLRAKASDAARIVLETGSLASWLWHELRGRNFPVICLDARHVRAALSMRVNKTDRNDARGLAELAWMGWYREANVKSMESRYTHSLLAARAKLVDLRRDVENQMRGLLKGLGLPPGKAGIKALLEKIVDVENQMRGLLKGLGLPPGKAGIKALLEKIVVIMREPPHLAKRVGIRKAKTAVARKLAVVLHCIWVDGTEFQWGKEKA
jgi:transposase